MKWISGCMKGGRAALVMSSLFLATEALGQVCGDPGAGDCCTPGGNGTPACDNLECCDVICLADPFCCDTTWDGICATAANNEPLCNCPEQVESCCFPDQTCQDILPSACLKAKGTPGGFGSTCALANCVPEACCLGDTGECVEAVPADCLAQNGTPQGFGSTCPTNCPWDLSGNGSVGAEDLAMLLGAWGNPYGPVELAALLGSWGPCVPGPVTCPLPCNACGDEGCGDCFDPAGNGSPFCDDALCCATVCSFDPFCCNSTWDALCAGEAIRFCSCKKGDEPANDACEDATVIGLGVTAVDNTCAGVGDLGHATCNDGFLIGLGPDVWYIYTAGASGNLTISLCGTIDWDSQLAVYAGEGGCASLSDATLIVCNLDGPVPCIDGQSEVVLNVVEGNIYYIRLGGEFTGPSGTGTMSLTLQ